MSFILASESPRRRELLRRLLSDFEIKSAGVEELKSSDDIRLLPLYNAIRKASAVAQGAAADWVLGADTVVLFENRVIGKPHSLAEALEILMRLSGHTHEVMTGLSLRCEESRTAWNWSEVSYVRFLPFDRHVAERYLQAVSVLDKAGAYAIQEHGEWIVASYSGEMENIVGLPLEILRRHLTEAGIL